MRVYRVCSAAYSELDGEGARLYGGRWNSAGIAVVYTASSLALAILETRVHLVKLPVDYVRLTIEVSDSALTSHRIEAAALGPNWTLDAKLTRKVGDEHFAANPMIPLCVPSVVVDSEWNYLMSREFCQAHATVIEKVPLTFDARLWTS